MAQTLTSRISSSVKLRDAQHALRPLIGKKVEKLKAGGSVDYDPDVLRNLPPAQRQAAKAVLAHNF